MGTRAAVLHCSDVCASAAYKQTVPGCWTTRSYFSGETQTTVLSPSVSLFYGTAELETKAVLHDEDRGQKESPLCELIPARELMPTYQNAHLSFTFATESKQQVLSTHAFSKIILVKRFFRFWWKFSGNRARMSSAPVKPRNTTCRVRLCRADTSCGKEEGKGLCSAQQHHGGLSLPQGPAAAGNPARPLVPARPPRGCRRWRGRRAAPAGRGGRAGRRSTPGTAAALRPSTTPVGEQSGRCWAAARQQAVPHRRRMSTASPHLQQALQGDEVFLAHRRRHLGADGWGGAGAMLGRGGGGLWGTPGAVVPLCSCYRGLQSETHVENCEVILLRFPACFDTTDKQTGDEFWSV